MNAKKIPAEIINKYRQVTVASVADALWEKGISGHLPHEIKPIFPAKIVGPAVTVEEVPSEERIPPTHALDIIDNCESGSVVVISIGGYSNIATWGGIMTAGAVVNELEGAVLDGGVRDVEEIERDYKFPIFARSIHPATTIGRFITISSNNPVRIGDVIISAGDLVVGDRDGVVVVPIDHVEDVVDIALAIEERESEQVQLIMESRSLKKGLNKYRRI